MTYKDRELAKEMKRLSHNKSQRKYSKNHQQILSPEKRKITSRNRKIERKNWLNNYKKDKCCLRCGYKENTEILEFHHRNKDEKSFGISRSVFSVKKTLEEIKKCDLLCPNCHMLFHNYPEKF